jgi:hypothetical protein
MPEKLTSALPSDFVDLLRREAGNAASGNRRFVPRNFLMDEGAVSERAASYAQVILQERPSDFSAWGTAHWGYLTERVFVPRAPGATDGMSHHASHPDSLPETFRHPAAFARFGGAHVSLSLVRVERVASIAARAGVAETVVADPAREVSNGAALNSPEAQRLDALLELWQNQAQSRPVFAGFFEYFKDWFGNHPTADRNGWANHLRNAFGLYHLPAGTTVLVFRYTVGEIHRWHGAADVRPLVPPTVLDSNQSEAFCPAPAKRPTGHTVDLAARGFEPAGEVLHPWIPFSSKHVFRVGTIDAPLPASLEDARGTHLLAIRDLSGVVDYASDTDADLIGG